MSILSSSTITSGFVDLATFDELEKYMYGGKSATVYFVRDTRASTWFTQVPVTLSKASGTADFGQDWSVSVSRAGDYLLQTWLRVTIPSVTLSTASTSLAGINGGAPIPVQSARLRWTRNLMHNLVRECNITFNDLSAAKFDSYHLDFWAAFTTPAGKINGYNNMIGSVSTLTNAYAAGVPIPTATLNLPLPFFFSRDSGVALPTAALPYNEMRINFSFRNWSELLIVDNASVATVTTSGLAFSRPATSSDLIGGGPSLGGNGNNVAVWANYAIVSNDERKRMGCAPRDILIEQAQLAPVQSYTPATNNSPQYDIRFSHAIKALFFSVRNTTCASEWSNYTTASNVYLTPAVTYDAVTNPTPGSMSFDPISNVSLIYENTARLASMGSDYFSLVNPWYTAPTIPNVTGYHLYSYSLNLINPDPMGSTNYGKLTNVSIAPIPTQEAVDANGSTGKSFPAGATTAARKSGVDFRQTYEFRLTAVNNNIIRISGGALGFPVL
jgi:hypothetical protein